MNTAEYFEVFEVLVFVLAWAAAFLLPVLALAAVVYRFATWPFRSLEQARFLLDVIETGLNDGKRPEQAVVEAARQRGRDLEGPFQEVAARLEQGLTLGEALDRTPRLLPPQVTAMLKVGIEINDLRKILPAARKVLQDDLAEFRGSQYFDITMTIATSLALILVVQVLGTWVHPNVHATMTALDADKHVLKPILFDTLAAHRNLWAVLQIVFMFAVAAWGLVYLGGTERRVWIQTRFPQQAARIWEGLPWRRKRLQRDFSFLLAVLLDAHVPEEKAVALAAAGTGSADFNRRASAVIQDLREGLWLPSAIQHIDDEIEMHWRLLKAVNKQDGFLRALAGWHDWLESRAMQQEQIVINATQVATFVCNGVMVGLVAASVFQIIITVLNLTAP